MAQRHREDHVQTEAKTGKKQQYARKAKGFQKPLEARWRQRKIL